MFIFRLEFSGGYGVGFGECYGAHCLHTSSEMSSVPGISIRELGIHWSSQSNSHRYSPDQEKRTVGSWLKIRHFPF